MASTDSSASSDPTFDLGDAYAVETPDENRDLYRRWAATYESGFIASRGYIYHEHVAALFVEFGGAGRVLDVGCGTGIVGEALRERGMTTIDGVDISPEMVAEARNKRTAGGDPVYESFFIADLTTTIDVPSDTYDGVVCAGTFTMGHVGPEAIDEILRVGKLGATYSLGINRAHYGDRDFGARFDDAVAAGAIGPVDLTEVAMYTGESEDEHAGDTAFVARFVKSA